MNETYIEYDPALPPTFKEIALFYDLFETDAGRGLPKPLPTQIWIGFPSPARIASWTISASVGCA